MKPSTLIIAVFVLLASAPLLAEASEQTIDPGPRALWLIGDMDEDDPRSRLLKKKLLECRNTRFQRSGFVIGHRGAPLQFPEHTRESYVAAARMGAGVLECDVTLTRDGQMVCRHSQCDLHQTTTILQTPLASQCQVPPRFDDQGQLINGHRIRCCTSDITLKEFKTLQGKMDASNPEARSIEGFMGGEAEWRTTLYAGRGTLMTHAESIALFRELGVAMAPELKSISDKRLWMDLDGDGTTEYGDFDLDGDGEVDFTQQQYAQQLIDAYKAAGVEPGQVHPQSFQLEDIEYWLEEEPDFGRQAMWLDGRYRDHRFDHTDPATWEPTMDALVKKGVTTLAPPLWMLLRETAEGIAPSLYAEKAKAAGLSLVAWTFERSPPLHNDGAWYYRTIDGWADNDGDRMVVLDVLVQDVGISRLFTDWPSAVTYYANCLGDT